MGGLPYAGVFAIIPAHDMKVSAKWQLVVVRGERFAVAPCSSRATPEECLADVSRLTRRYTESEFFRALAVYNEGIGMEASATYREHVRKMLRTGLNVLEKDIRDVLVHAKTPKTVKPRLVGKCKPRLHVTGDTIFV